MFNDTAEGHTVVTKSRCGTRAGYLQHYKKKETYCDPCIQANRDYQKAFRESKKVPIEERVPPTTREQCGTPRGSDFHYYYGERPCDSCKIAYNQRSKDYYEKYPERRYLRNTKWSVENPEKFKESQNKWRKNNSEKIAAKNRRQRAIKAGAISEPYTSKQLLDLYGAVCHICNKEIDLNAPKKSIGEEGWENGLHLDHAIPLSKGGTDTINNVKPAHALCNLSKSNGLYDSGAQELL